MIKTLEELIEHMKKPDANNVFVVGPYIGEYALVTPEEADIFKLKGIVKQTQTFYDVLTQKILTPCDTLNEQFKALKPIVTTLFAQTINGNFAPSDLEVHFLKGDANQFMCSSCHKVYSQADVLEEKVYACECGRYIRPTCLLTNEKYDLELIESFEADLLEADTIFLIGFDFNELELCKQLEVIAARKGSGQKGPVVVVVGECDKEAVYETFKPEFIVDEKPKSALDRFIAQL